MRRRVHLVWVVPALVGVSLAFSIPTLRVGMVFRVHGRSMAPTFADGDFVIAVRQGSVHRGEVWIVRTPRGGRAIKRVVGLGGDTVRMQDGILTVNRSDLLRRFDLPHPEAVHAPGSWHYPYLLPEGRGQLSSGVNWGPILVPEGEFFVLGDNLAHSADSRSFGFIPQGSCQARVLGS